MSDTTTPSGTVPPPTPGDTLVARVINYVALLAVLCVVLIGVLLLADKAVPQILETIVTVAATALATLLSGRTQR